jgi:CheY-like chemotaxis protein
MNALLLTPNQVDRILFWQAVAGLGAEHTITVCESVEEFWTMLNLQRISLPNLILMDKSLADQENNYDFLCSLKNNELLRAVPVVLLTDSPTEEDVIEAYNLCIACLVALPDDIELRLSKVKACMEFWTNYAELPELRRWWPATGK